MKFQLLIFFFLVGVKNVIAQHTIIVEFTGVKSDKGDVYVALYNKKEHFLKKEYKGVIVNVNDNKAFATFLNIPNGEYAISSFHDANDNKKLDTNFIGIPKEPIGISNNAKGFMGPPKFRKAKFEVKEGVKLVIRIE